MELSSRAHLLLKLKQDQAYLLQASERFITQTAHTGLFNEDEANEVTDFYIRELVAAIEQDLKHSPMVMGDSSGNPPLGSVHPSTTASAPSSSSASLQDVDDPMQDGLSTSTGYTPDDLMEGRPSSLTDNQHKRDASSSLASRGGSQFTAAGNNIQPASFTSTPSLPLIPPRESAHPQPMVLPGNNNPPISVPLQPPTPQAGIDTMSSYSTSPNESGTASTQIPESQVPSAALFPSPSLTMPSQTLQPPHHCPSCGANQSLNSSSTSDNSNDNSDSETPLRERGKKRPKEVNAFNVRFDYLYSDHIY